MEEKNNKTESKIVQTFAEDMAKVIEDDRSGLIKKIIHEEEEHEMEKRHLSPESKKNKLFMSISVVILFVGLITFLYFFTIAKEVRTIPVEKQFAPIVFVDQSAFIEVKDLKKNAIIQTILNKANGTKVKKEGVEAIYLTENKNVIGIRRLMSLIEGNFNPPSNIVFVSENFLMGVANTENKDFFILLKMRSISDIFDSMRLWEKKMFSDLHGLFGIQISPETNYLFVKDFDDGIVENKNARILYDKDNNIALMYVFADENSVIVANSKIAAHEIMLRLASGQVKE